jgi:hypothetical protein
MLARHEQGFFSVSHCQDGVPSFNQGTLRGQPQKPAVIN